MANHTPLITLLTDFGTSDHYVAQMKAVILSLAPHARIVDVTHEIQPQDVMRAAFILRQIWDWFPENTIHVGVVDPGVGSTRRIIAGRYSGRFVVSPDNGLISLIHRQLRPEAVHVVENRHFLLPQVSATFHGRDIMSPVAAHLANGVDLSAVGPPVRHVEVLDLAAPRPLPNNGLAGEVLYADRFGNLVTNIRREDLTAIFQHRSDFQVHVDGRSVGPIRASYHEVDQGEAVALVGSTQHLEIAVNFGSASQELSAKRGTAVEVK